jgi:hypothetical protein
LTFLPIKRKNFFKQGQLSKPIFNFVASDCDVVTCIGCVIIIDFSHHENAEMWLEK